jgi:hypothetical protein
MVFFLPLATRKGRNGGIVVNSIAPWPMLVRQSLQNYKDAEHSLRLLQVINERWQSKKVFSAIGNLNRIFSSRICQSLYYVKPKAQLERSATLLHNWQLGA